MQDENGRSYDVSHTTARLRTDRKQRQQQSTLKNALAGGPQNVHLKRQKSPPGTRRYAFSVFELDFELPRQLGDNGVFLLHL